MGGCPEGYPIGSHALLQDPHSCTAAVARLRGQGTGIKEGDQGPKASLTSSPKVTDMTLRESPPGAVMRVTGVRLAPAAAFRLNEMGIRLGTLAHITQQAAFGGRVVAVAGSRFALDGGTAGLIDVEHVNRRG